MISRGLYMANQGQKNLYQRSPSPKIEEIDEISYKSDGEQDNKGKSLIKEAPWATMK